MISRHLCVTLKPLARIDRNRGTGVSASEKIFNINRMLARIRQRKERRKKVVQVKCTDRHKIPHRSMKISDWSVKIKFNSNFFPIPDRAFLRVRSELSKNSQLEKFIGILLMKFALNSTRWFFPTRIVRKKKKLRNKLFSFEDMARKKRRRKTRWRQEKLFSPNSIYL